MQLRSAPRLARWLAAATLAATVPLYASADDYPSRPVKVVVPFKPGGAVDTVARVVGEPMSKLLGQSVVVENKPGGNADIGANFVAKSAPDGYTTLLGANGLTTNPTLEPHMLYKPLTDLVPVARVGYAPLVLVVPAKSPAKTLKELIDYAKAHPDAMNYGSAAVGGSGHLASELFDRKAGIKATHIVYSGGAPALTDLIAGRLTYMIINPLEAAPHVKAGRLRALAVSSDRRIAALPDVPTFTEAGLQGFDATVWWGYLVPAGTPKDVVDKLSKAILESLEDAKVKQRLTALGAVIAPQDSQQFGAFLKSETDKWADVIHAAHIKKD